MFDLLVRGGTVVDGTGSPAFRGNVAVNDGRIVAIGGTGNDARHVVDADGLIVAPGFVDPHVHYDAQLFWDPAATPSLLHGVTSMLCGNCGFTIAPLHEKDADYTRRMLSKVEGMALVALEVGVPWNWESFSEYLGRLEGRIGVNAAFMVGHSAIRLFVMGERALSEEASDDDLGRMCALLDESLANGGAGFSTTRSMTHTDENGDPVPSRLASDQELLALCEVVGRHEGTTIEVLLPGCVAAEGFSEPEIELLLAMTMRSKRPVNWGLIRIEDMTRVPRIARQLEPSRRATTLGGRIAAMTLPVQMPETQSLLNHCNLHMLPDWPSIFLLPVPARMEKLRDPAVRKWLRERAQGQDAIQGGLGRFGNFGSFYRVGEVFSEENRGLEGRLVGDIAASRGQDPLDTLLDIGLNDNLETVFWTVYETDEETWKARSKTWEDPDVLIGGTDAGAHSDQIVGAILTTAFLGEVLRGQGKDLISPERAVQLITDEPARYLGLTRRGRIAPSYYADLVLLDPDRIGSGAASYVRDLPGGDAARPRLTAPSEGIEKVFVNGVEAVTNGKYNDTTSGTVLRSRRDTSGTRTPAALTA